MRKFCIILSCIIIITGLLSITANAVSMPPIEDKPTGLTINFVVETDGKKVPVSGAYITICKVADLTCKNGAAHYTLLPEYKSLQKLRDGVDITFDGIGASESKELARKLSYLVKDASLTKKTDTTGKCQWEDMPKGMYLVREIGKSGIAAQYSTFEPYLMSLPLGYAYPHQEPYWQYDVESYPKSIIVREGTDTSPDTNSDTENTDLHSDSSDTNSENSDSGSDDPDTMADSTDTNSENSDSDSDDPDTMADSTDTNSDTETNTDTDTNTDTNTDTDTDIPPVNPDPPPDNIVNNFTSVINYYEEYIGKKVITGDIRNIALPSIIFIVSLFIVAAMMIWKKMDKHRK